MRKALVDKSGNVVNIVVVEGEYTPPPGLDLVDVGTEGQKGDKWDGDKIIPKPKPVGTPNPTSELHAAIDAANNFTELKAALLGQTRAGKVSGEAV